MNENETQLNEMTPEEAKAALGNATFLQEQMLSQMAPQEEMMPDGEGGMPMEAPQDAEMAPTAMEEPPVEETTTPEMEPAPEEDMEAKHEDMMKDMEKKMEEKVKSAIQEEMKGVKKMIKEAIDGE